ncbi:MAG: MBL fold metallo-hydrolase [Chitinophagaceae bacterium]
MALEITFLGTGTSQGVPFIGCQCAVCQSPNSKDQRLRSSLLVQSKETTLVIDTGPDFRQQMLRSKTQKIDAILFTHSHKDHIAGLDDIRAFNYHQGKAIDVYASLETQEVIKREFPYIFSEYKYPGIPEINLVTIDKNTPFAIQDIHITPIEVMHYKMPVLGFRMGNFTYITDANFIEEPEKEKIKGSATMVLNALRKEKHISHFTLDEAIALSTELNIPSTYFTHISHQLGLHEAESQLLPSNFYLAFDGLNIRV